MVVAGVNMDVNSRNEFLNKAAHTKYFITEWSTFVNAVGFVGFLF